MFIVYFAEAGQSRYQLHRQSHRHGDTFIFRQTRYNHDATQMHFGPWLPGYCTSVFLARNKWGRRFVLEQIYGQSRWHELTSMLPERKVDQTNIANCLSNGVQAKISAEKSFDPSQTNDGPGPSINKPNRTHTPACNSSRPND